eukprot:TRINITY_DN1477_c0_g1_i2.p1 TRINITY_DN1477_c0_g1~~TRINITY_DN1477_c0_g1_i2.p1  ORF type:complete len:193 (-),score=40.54 TRINITY_DN1477_c0_g1_i2:99-677(-)
MPKVSFRIHYVTNLGQTVYLSGAGMLLGEWQNAKKLTWTPGHWWVLELNLPTSLVEGTVESDDECVCCRGEHRRVTLQYKYFLGTPFSNRSGIWEKCASAAPSVTTSALLLNQHIDVRLHRSGNRVVRIENSAHCSACTAHPHHTQQQPVVVVAASQGDTSSAKCARAHPNVHSIVINDVWELPESTAVELL